MKDITYQRMKIVMIALCLVILILFGIKFELEQSLNLEGPVLENLQNESQQYKLENMALKNMYLHKAAYTTISQEATREGFVPAQIIYLQ